MKNLNSIYKSQNAIGSARNKDKKVVSKLPSNGSSFQTHNKADSMHPYRAKQGSRDMKKNYSSTLLKNPDGNLSSSGVDTEKVGDNNVI